MSDIYDRIRILIRDFAGRSESRFARMIGTSPQNINRILNRRSSIGHETVEAICRTFGISSDWLIFGGSTPSPKLDLTADLIFEIRKILEEIERRRG